MTPNVCVHTANCATSPRSKTRQWPWPGDYFGEGETLARHQTAAAIVCVLERGSAELGHLTRWNLRGPVKHCGNQTAAVSQSGGQSQPIIVHQKLAAPWVEQKDAIARRLGNLLTNFLPTCNLRAAVFMFVTGLKSNYYAPKRLAQVKVDITYEFTRALAENVEKEFLQSYHDHGVAEPSSSHVARVRDIVDDLHVPWPQVGAFYIGSRWLAGDKESLVACPPVVVPSDTTGTFCSESRPSSFALWDGGGSREEERRGSESWQLLGLSMPTEPVAEHGFCGRTGLVGWEDNRRRAPVPARASSRAACNDHNTHSLTTRGAFSGRTAWRVTHGANHGGGENVPATMPHASWWWLGGGTGDFWIIRSRRSLRRCSTARRTELINICMKAASKQWRDWVLVMSGGPLLAPVVLEKEGEGSRGRAGLQRLLLPDGSQTGSNPLGLASHKGLNRKANNALV
ncbi:hypothetical protein Bbelb_407710 [Branchiostoma belcheri]|nr:hypothetical protein Bbelb_407710 [Branchiostoma belcheri]